MPKNNAPPTSPTRLSLARQLCDNFQVTLICRGYFLMRLIDLSFWAKLLLGMMTLYNLGCATGLKETQSRIEQTTSALLQNQKNFQDPVWPQFNILENPIIFISHRAGWAERFEQGTRSPLDFSVWKKKIPLFNPIYFRTTIDGKRTLVMNMDQPEGKDLNTFINRIYHEGFHEFEQSFWDRKTLSNGRGSLYPLQVIPRYYRWEMQQSLKSYLVTEAKIHLRHYSYWYFKWRDNFKEEHDNFTDILEGSAEYYATRMMTPIALKNTNETFSPKSYFLNSKLMNNEFSEKFDLSFESYVLGTLSGLTLDELKVKNWKQRVENGLSSLEILANFQKPLKKKINGEAQGRFVKASVREMEKIDKNGKLDRLISHLANPNVIKVAFPTARLYRSTFETNAIYRSFFDYPGVTGVQFISLKKPHQVEGQDLKLKYNKNDYWVTASTTPCGWGHSTLLLLDPEQTQVTAATLVTNSLSFNTLEGTRKIHKNVTWFCPNLKLNNSSS